MPSKEPSGAGGVLESGSVHDRLLGIILHAIEEG
jgi:hypothetical protein